MKTIRENEVMGEGKAPRLTLATLKSEAKKLGAVVEDDSAGRWVVYQVVAPEGKLWADGYTKHIKIEWPDVRGALRESELRDGINRIRIGLVDDEETSEDTAPRKLTGDELCDSLRACSAKSHEAYVGGN